MKDVAGTVFVAVVIVIMLAAVAAWMTFQWTECRDMGFSFWYCVQHIA